MIGTVLGNRYEIISELGQGGMAHVYLAADLHEGHRVAIKVLYPQYSQDIGFLQRFAQEAKLATSFSQAASEMHIVRVLDYGSDRDTHYLVMEYVEGRDLGKVLEEEGALPWRQALHIGRQVAVALEHAHQRGIVHRDIKPGNVMILPDDRVRVLDFGVARALSSPTLTYSGFVGSPNYVSPEQAMGRSVDVRSDLYSLGIMLYEMIGGQLPFRTDTPWIAINDHIATPPPLLEDLGPDLPRAVIGLVRKAMAKRPEDRYQTPSELVEAMDAVLSGLDLPIESSSTEPETLAPILAGFYEQAEQAMQAEEWQDAVDLFSQILKFEPRYRDVADQLADAGRQARLSALYTAAHRALRAGQWADALAQLDEIASVAPGYRDVQALLTQVRQKHELDQLYRQGVEYFEAGKWSKAVKCLAQVRDRDPNYERTEELLAKAHAAQGQRQEEARPAAEQEPSHPERPRRRGWLGAVVALLIVALAVESLWLYLALRPQDPTNPSSTLAGTATLVSPVSPTGRSTSSRSEAGPSATLGPTSNSVTAARTTATSVMAGGTTGPKAAQTTGTDTSPAATFTPTATPILTPTTMPAATKEPRLAGQIAFPRFDPVRETFDVYACHVDGSNCRLVTTEASQPHLLPDGTRLVLHSWKADYKGLILQTLSGQFVWHITASIEAARPSVDSLGENYVYHSRQEADRQPRLYRTYGPDTGPILREGRTILGVAPSWLPDGRILYSGCLSDACGIIVMDADGSRPRQVVAGGTETNPEASPDGQQVVYMSQRDGNWELYVANLDGSNLRRLTNHPANDSLPTWSPDGRHIAFVSDRGGNWAVWVMRSDGSNQRLLFGLGGPLEGRVRGAADHEVHGWIEERISWAPLP